MDNPSEIAEIAVPNPPGLITRGVSAIVGLVAGAGAMVTAVNKSITANLRHTAKSGFKALDEFGSEMLMDDTLISNETEIAELRTEARHRFKDGFIADIENEDLRQAVSNKSTLLGKALREARGKQKLDPQADVLLKAVLAEKLEEGPVNIRRDLAHLVVHDEKHMAEGMLRDAPSHIPLGERLRLSPKLFLSGRQKATAVLAFAGVAAVTAGAFYYGAKHLKSNANKAFDAHEAGII